MNASKSNRKTKSEWMMAIILFLMVSSLQATDKLAENLGDAAISNRVKIVLLQQLSLNFSVITCGGVVTLSGVASDSAERDLNSKLTAEINGVKGVVNNMLIPSTVAKNN